MGNVCFGDEVGVEPASKLLVPLRRKDQETFVFGPECTRVVGVLLTQYTSQDIYVSFQKGGGTIKNIAQSPDQPVPGAPAGTRSFTISEFRATIPTSAQASA